jgi:hypothetical protein
MQNGSTGIITTYHTFNMGSVNTSAHINLKRVVAVHIRICCAAQKSVNLKYSVVSTGMFRFKPASQFVEWYHSVVSCALDMEDHVKKM